jgi:hypothetical protein
LSAEPLVGAETFFRDVAQPGSAFAWGARGRWFESSRPDEQEARSLLRALFFWQWGEFILLNGRKNKAVPTKSEHGFLGNKEGFQIAEGNPVVPTNKKPAVCCGLCFFGSGENLFS